MNKKVLLIIDCIDLVLELCKEMQKQNIEVIVASTLREAVHRFIKDNYCLIIMEESFALENNCHLIRAMRKARSTPILVLSSHKHGINRLEVLRAGAHCYLDKTNSNDECVAQAISLITLYMELTPINEQKHIISFGESLIIDEVSRQVFLKGQELKLTKKEFDVLHCLASNPGRVFTREQLYDLIWDEKSAFNVDEVVKTHIKTLRQKLSDADAQCIKNVWGVGYRFHHEDSK